MHFIILSSFWEKKGKMMIDENVVRNKNNIRI